ncbi:hypothetical protein Hanom_Chr04g00309731 [Helianthus anomalus]
MRDRTRARLDSSFVFKARARLVYYLLVSILNENNINNRLFRLVSSISEARARLLNKLIFRFGVGLLTSLNKLGSTRLDSFTLRLDEPNELHMRGSSSSSINKRALF